MYSVKSTNFDFHPVVFTETYDEAVRAAKERGWEAQIYYNGKMIASWSPIYGVKTYR
jgi:hypothetical protein